MYLPLMLILAAAPAAPQSWTFDTDGTPEIHVSNIEGPIQVQAVDGSKVTIEAQISPPSKGGQPVTLSVAQDGDEIEAKVCCGECQRSRNTCKGTMPRVRWTLKVPKRSELKLSAVDAQLSVNGVTGEQEHHSVTGAVSVVGSEDDVSINTVEADVRLAPARLTHASQVEIGTVSGDVRLELPRSADATLTFTAVSGRLDGKSVTLGTRSRTFGKGGATLDVNTVDGEVTVTER